LSRHPDEKFETKSSPQKNQRLEVPRTFLETGIEDIRTHIRNARTELVFHLDEIGTSKSEDCIERKVIVTSIMRDEKIFSGIHRDEAYFSGSMYLSVWRPHDTFCCLFSR
jgi:hypothetical protein